MHLHVHSVGMVHGQCNAFELLSHVDGCVVIGHQVFMSDFVLSANLVEMSIESPRTLRCLTPISSMSCIPINIALYSTTLLEHGSVSKNA